MVQARSSRRGAPGRGFHHRLRALPRARQGTAVPAAADPQRAVPERGLTLARLLDVARLTPAQAVAVGTDVLAALDDPLAAGAARSGLDRADVRVAPDGRAHLVDDRADDRAGDKAGDKADDRRVPAAARQALATAAAVIGDLTAAARSPADATGPPAAGPLAALGRAAAEARREDGSLATVSSILRDADATYGGEARAELARLVSAAGGGVAPRGPTRAAGVAVRHSSAALPRRPRRRPGAVARAVLARSWKWVLTVVVLAAVVLTEIVVLRDDIARDIEAVLDAGRSGSAAVTDAPALPPVVPPAPAGAGTITAVDLRAVTPCRPDAVCHVRTQVMLQPLPEPRTVTWAFQVLDRCTGAAATVPGGTVTVPPDADRADAVDTVALPPGHALAVLALTSLPATTASGPLLVPADGACAPHPAGPAG
jgi:hypothetical protein